MGWKMVLMLFVLNSALWQIAAFFSLFVLIVGYCCV